MKKAISLLVALATASSLGMATFAADDTPGTATPYDTDDIVSIAPRVGFAPSSDADLVVGKNELFLVDATNYVIGAETHLIPDEEYKFDIWVNDSDADETIVNGQVTLSTTLRPLVGGDLDGGTVRVRSIKGSSAISSVKIKTRSRGVNATYQLEINTRANYGTKMTDVEYNLVVTGIGTNTALTGTNKTIANSALAFEVGFPSISDDETEIGEDGYITINNDTPVIKKDQFTDIAKSANYKAVNIEGEDGGWLFKGRVSGTKDSNLYFSYDVVPELMEHFPDQDYKFLDFKGGVTFAAMGEMRIDVSDIRDDFGTMYTYLYNNGRLTQIDTTYDNATEEIFFRTNHLGTFVITDMEITDTALVGNPEEEVEPEEEEEEEEEEERGNNGNNPNTGASRGVNVAVTLGLASLVAAGAISRKKK